MNYKYNYYCLNNDCDNIKINYIVKDDSEEDKEEYCIVCNQEMKCVGQSTNITHIGTQESKINKT